ncbi:MAG: ATP-grasp domain-containing protein, partial [Acidobacteriota bacterium]
MSAPRKIGILRGSENAFPDALISHINHQHAEKARAEYFQIDNAGLEESSGFEVILDRISHRVPFYRSYLKWAALHGTAVVNDPFRASSSDRPTDATRLRAAGLRVPKTLVLPHKNRPQQTGETTLRNLRFPVRWEHLFAHVGFPCWLRRHDAIGWEGATLVHSGGEFFAAYDTSGESCMMIQQAVAAEEFARCLVIGGETRVLRFNPTAPLGRRYADVPEEALAPALARRLAKEALTLAETLGQEITAVDFALAGGSPWVVDWADPAPAADRTALGEAVFSWMVSATASLLVTRAAGVPRQAATS